MLIKFQTIIFSILLTTIWLKSNAQLIVDDNVKLKRGVYRSFEEFKFNNPSYLVDFEVMEKERVGYYYLSYIIEFKSKENKISDREIWGFCDGENVFINGFNGTLGTPYYDKIILLGRYCYFNRYVPGSPGMPTGMGGVVGSRLPSVNEMIINFNSGKVFQAIKENMETLLKQDQSLYEEYELDKDRKHQYSYYIRTYNQKHPDEIKR